MSRKKTNKIEAETGEVVQSNRPFIIRNGGIAKPLGHGLYLLGGKTHEQGGIDIDFTGDARIFSAQPILNGNSPAELVVKGANPNQTFIKQERFKNVNGIDDDGSRKAKYGLEKENNGYYKRLAKAALKKFTLDLDKQRERFYNHYNPYYAYTIPNMRKAVELAIAGPDFARAEHNRRYAKKSGDYVNKKFIEGAKDEYTDAIWAKYLKIPENKRKYNYELPISDYAPTIGRTNSKYYTLSKPLPNKFIDDIIQDTRDLPFKGSKNTDLLFSWDMGTSTLSRGFDNKGEYVSYSDTWDINPLHGKYSDYEVKNNKWLKKIFNNDGKDIFGKITNPIPIYDRIYLDEHYGINSAPKDGEYYGGYLPELIADAEWINARDEYEKLISKEMQTKNNSNKKQLGGSTGLIRVQANGKDRLMYVPFTGEETKANRKKAAYGIELNAPKLSYDFTKVDKIMESLKEGDKNKNWWKDNGNYVISGLGNIGAGIVSHLINKNMLKDLNYAPAPIAKTATKLKTNININPELNALNENLFKSIESTNANVASSRVANAMNQAAVLNTTLAKNKLYADKENRESALINQDRINQQEVANANIDAYNTWRTDKTDFENNIREKQYENVVALADTANKTTQDIVSEKEKRRQFMNNLAVMAAAYPNVAPELIRSYGADFLRMGGKVKYNKKK